MNSKHVVILFVTIHDVMAAEKALKQAGLWCDLVPTPRQLSSDCGMALLAKTTELQNVRDALGQGKLILQAIYQQNHDGYEQLAE